MAASLQANAHALKKDLREVGGSEEPSRRRVEISDLSSIAHSEPLPRDCPRTRDLPVKSSDPPGSGGV
jgi:hypothetical protein